MSKRNPIYISESEEEPMEDSYQSSENTEEESSTNHPQAAQNNSNNITEVSPNATVVTPITAPVNAPEQVPADILVHASENATAHTTIPTAASEIAKGATSKIQKPSAEFPAEQTLRRTARIRVREVARESLTSKGKAPITESEIPEVEPPQKRIRPTHLEWMPRLLGEWRALEGIPTTMELGESSRSSPPVFLTGESLETTVPTLVAVVHSLFKMQLDRRRVMREVMNNASRTSMNIASFNQRINTVENHQQTDGQNLENIHAHVIALERRARVTEIVAGICIVAVAVMAALGIYL